MANVNQVGNTLNGATGTGQFVGDTSPTISSLTLSTPLTVGNGGTGNSSLTAYAVLCGGTTGTSAVQALASLGTSGQVLTSNGPGALPSMQDAAGGGNSAFAVYQQIFTASGTYTPTTNMKFCIAEAQGGGGGGGGAASTAGQSGIGGGGGGGGYAMGVFTDSDIGASQVVTIGAAGAGGASGNNAGTAGGTTSLGSLLSVGGGGAGSGASGTATAQGIAGGAAGTATTGTVKIPGQSGAQGITIAGSNGVCVQGFGGNSQLGRGGVNYGTGVGTGAAGEGFGGGGSGGYGSGGNQAGGAGKAGIIIITEFVTTTTTPFYWNQVTTNTQALANNFGYITNNGATLVTYSLPATAAVGDIVEIVGYSSGGFTISQAAGQSIIMGTSTSTVGVGGSVSSTVASNQLKLMCVVANTTWTAMVERGNFNVV